MNREHVIGRLKSHEAELRGMGVAHLSLFGSLARGDALPASDVDLAAEFDRTKRPFTAFDFVDVESKLAAILGIPVDLVGEPARKPRMQGEIDRDRVRVF